MKDRNSDSTVSRALHDLGLAAWFGGSLMGAIGLNGATRELSSSRDRLRAANSGWGRWAPAQFVAILAYLFGSLKITAENKGRLTAQKNVASVAMMKAGCTGAALAATAYAQLLGQRMMTAEEERGDALDVDAATAPSPHTPSDVADVQRKLRVAQVAVPVLTGVLVVLNAKMGEQQRVAQVTRGIIARLTPDRD